MKKFWNITLVAFLVLLPITALAQNLVENGGFEYRMFNWTILDQLGNTLEVRPNNQTGIAIEGSQALYVGIWKAQPGSDWKTSIKYQLPVILETGNYVLEFSVAKLSDKGNISAGIQDNRPPHTSFFWTGNVDISHLSKGTVNTYRYNFDIGQAIMYPAVILNFAGVQQEIVVDKIVVQKKSEYYQEMTVVSGKVTHPYRKMPKGLHVVLYPDGDFFNEQAMVVSVSDDGNWEATVLNGRAYTVELYQRSGTIVYRLFTTPWLWRLNATDGKVSGMDFYIRGVRLFNNKEPFQLNSNVK